MNANCSQSRVATSWTKATNLESVTKKKLWAAFPTIATLLVYVPTKIESDLQLSSARTGFGEAKLNTYLDLLVLIIPQFASLFEGNTKSFDFLQNHILFLYIGSNYISYRLDAGWNWNKIFISLRRLKYNLSSLLLLLLYTKKILGNSRNFYWKLKHK